MTDANDLRAPAPTNKPKAAAKAPRTPKVAEPRAKPVKVAALKVAKPAAAPKPPKAAKVAKPATAAPAAEPVDTATFECLINGERFATPTEAIARLKFLAALATKNKVKRPKGAAEPTAAQSAIIGLALRPEGATAKELMTATNWPSIAAETTCAKIAARFGYTFHKLPKAEGLPFRYKLEQPAQH